MHTLTVLLQVITLLLAAMAGCSLARQGVAQGVAFGAVNARVGRWRLVADSLQFRDDRFFYRLAVVPAP